MERLPNYDRWLEQPCLDALEDEEDEERLSKEDIAEIKAERDFDAGRDEGRW